jgi:hypothetical protein
LAKTTRRRQPCCRRGPITRVCHPIDWTWFEIWHHEGRLIIHEYGDEAPQEVAVLQQLLTETMASDNWKWSLNQEDPAVREDREKRQKAFKDRYK